MLRKRLIIASLIIALVCVCSITGCSLKRAQAVTMSAIGPGVSPRITSLGTWSVM